MTQKPKPSIVAVAVAQLPPAEGSITPQCISSPFQRGSTSCTAPVPKRKTVCSSRLLHNIRFQQNINNDTRETSNQQCELNQETKK